MIDEKELLSMKLIHYFIVKENYNPIIIKGVEDEIWLENKNNVYSMIRVVTRKINNEEQYDFDLRKTKHIAAQIKMKTFDFSMRVLSIYLNCNYKIENIDKKFTNIIVKNDEDIINDEKMKKEFKNIELKFKYEEKGYDLISKLTVEISNKNYEEGKKREELMKTKKPIITLSLIIINVIIFTLMYLLGNGSENTKTLINFGANYVALTKSGEYYRLLTSAFLHIGVIHLLLNMYSLYIIGTQIEYFYGKIKYSIIYLFSALMGSLFTIVLSSENTVAAGASGAIFGLLGSMLYFGYHYRGYIGNAIIGQIIPVIILNLFIGFTTPGIGNAAHIGGLIGGYIISMALGFDKENNISKVHGTIISILLTVFMVYFGFIK